MNKKKWAWYALIFSIILSILIITIEIYSIEEENIKTSITENQVKIQEIIAKSISKNISSEIELIVFELGELAESEELQKDIGTVESSQLIAHTFSRLNSISPTAQILALDEKFTVQSQVSKTHNSFVGATVKGLSELINSEKNSSQSEPAILSIDTLLFDEPEIAITYPIIDEETKIPKGLLLVTFASSEFFKRHGNIYDVESQFLMVMDENHILLIDPSTENIGKNFFDEEIQQQIGNNSFSNNHIKNVLQGNLATAIFTLNDDIGERIITGIPVVINDKIEFMFAVVTPTQSINKEIDEIIFYTKIQTVFLLLAITVVLLAFLLKRSQSFKKEKLTVIGQLSSNIAHDIRNPLGTIKNAGVIISKENNDKNEIISREINRINLSVRRISHQIEEVLNYVRTTPLILKPHSINQTLYEAIDTLTIPKNIEINTPKNDMTIKFDHEKILIVFVNIILNAIQSIGDEKGHINISTQETESDIIIKFENSGPNIPLKDLKHIFDTLFTTKLEGTGLGLSSCKNIVEQHKGDIKAANNPVVFSIRLPK
ncbi:MAG: GHKL domain-containing protein [Nitrosopumilus sp.]|uniref:sensor histidine kinase n=1 Tax=Nitrosopumilus sp. TaxID=2024843 RepID=UPI00243255A9|nr:ATP-binding protein [Nitrosopumilus sp.]MCV0367597.1 GHKL domain-containing protein [Nitrosopumilus sp.]